MSKSAVESLTGIVVDLAEKAPIHVLHVDDEAGFVKVAKRCLNTEGAFQVDTATSVEEAVKKMKKKTFDVIVCDYMMPGKDGLELLKELRGKGNDIPFIIFTGKGREEVAIKALNLGADQYLNKIGDPETVYGELAHSIHQAVEKREALVKLRQSLENIKRRSDELATLMESSTKMMRARDLRQRLKVVAEAIRKIGWRRVVISVRDENLEIVDLVTEGLTKDEVKLLLERKAPGNVWRERFGPRFKRFKIGEFYYLPWSDPWVREKVHDVPPDASPEEVTTYAGVPSKISPEEMVDWHPQDLLYAPLRLRDERIVGIISIDDPLDGRRPNKDSLVPLELFLYQAAVAIENAQLMHARTERKKAEELYRSLVELSPESIITVDRKGVITSCNPAATRMLGYSEDELIGKHFGKTGVLRAKDLPSYLKLFNSVLRGKVTKPLELTFYRKGGTPFLSEIRLSLMKEGGKTIGIRTIGREVTEDKKAEENLRGGENYLETILNSIFTGVVVVDEKTHEIVDANPNALETIGTSREHVIGKVCHRFICPAEKGRCPISDLGQTVDKSERVLLRANGERIPILKTVTPTMWRGHKYLIESFLDITERKKAEKALQKSGESFRTLMEEAPIGICNTDLKGKITYVNKRFEEATGYSREEIVGKNGFKLGIMSDETLQLLAKRMKKRLMGKPGRLLEGRFKCKDGEWIWAEIEAKVIKKFGVPVGFQLAARDITERKRAEEESKRFEERLSALNTYSRRLNAAENMAEMYGLTLDAMEKTLGFENAAFMVVDKDMLRVADQHGFPQPHLSLKLPLNRKRGVTVKAAKTGRPVLVPDIRKERAYVEIMPGIRSELDVPIKIGHKVIGVLNVESKRLNAFDEKDQKLLEILASHAATAISNLESQQKFKRLFMNNPEAADYLDPDFHILDVNPRFEELFGYSLDEIKGKHINDVVVPKDKKEEAEILDKKAEEGIVYYDTVRKRKDGSLVPVSISAAPITIEEKIIGTVGVYKDISQLKKTEKTLKNTLEKLETMNEKLRVVGSLIRHDVRNKLSTVTGNIFLAKRRITSDHEVLEYLKDVESACRQVERIFDFARTYEKLGVEELAYMDVEKSLGEAVSLFSDLHGVNVKADCPRLTVLADSLLNQLFYNLIDNSLKHGEKASRIRAYYEELGEGKLKLVYEDNGVGLPKAEKEKIFNEGYGKGAGYGLYLIRKICEVYGWAIRETGKPGKGAQFTITIPKMNENMKENYQLN